MEHPESLTTWDNKTKEEGKQYTTRMEHQESLTTWDTQDTGGRQTKHNTEWNIQSH